MKILRKIKISDVSLSEDVVKNASMYIRETENIQKSIRSEFDKIKSGKFDADVVISKANALIKLAKLISE